MIMVCTIEVSVPIVCPVYVDNGNKKYGRHDDRFDNMFKLDFMKFREIEDFPVHLERWVTINQEYFAAENKKFNQQEVVEWMEKKWAAAMKEPGIVVYTPQRN